MRIETDLSHVAITLSPIGTLLAMKHSLHIPTANITSAAAMDRSEVPARGLIRAPGTYVPGLLTYGSFGVGEHRQFWAVPGRPRVLVIDIDGWHYSRVVLAISDPDQAAASINAALPK
jgi:hypothetical protein